MIFDFAKIEKYWWFKKHQGQFEFSEIDHAKFRANLVSTGLYSPNLQKNKNDMFDWEAIQPKHSFFYDYVNNVQEISFKLKNSLLAKQGKVFIEMPADVPVIIATTDYFINNWSDFIDANNQMGCIVASENMKLLMEFTGDARYQLFSNFKI